MRVSRTYGDTMPVSELALADFSETKKVSRTITEDERAALSSSVTELSIQEEDTKDAKKASTAAYNATLKSIALEKKGLLRSLRTGRRDIEAAVACFKDFDNLKIHEYDEEGNRTLTRRMTAEEAQLEINH